MKWYHKPIIVVLAIFSLGPLALPVLWGAPSFKKWHKILISAIVITGTIMTIKGLLYFYNVALEETEATLEILGE